MPPSSPVADYLAALGRDLAFDPALSRRVRQEVEDHLREAAITKPNESTIDAENRAIMRFGTPQKIADQYRTISLHMRMKRTGLLVGGAVLVAFGAMEIRVVWYGLTRWDIGDRLKSVGQTVVPIDRYAFLLAIILGTAGSIYIASRRLPAAYGSTSRSQILYAQFLIAGEAAAAAVAVTCEAMLTGWRLAEAHWTTDSLLPMGSLLIEIGIVFAAAVYIRNTFRWTSAIMRHQSSASGSGEAY
jgi:hypothetical protein